MRKKPASRGQKVDARDKNGKIHLTRQQALVLNLLRKNGRSGVLNLALNKISFRYGARIFELEGKGWKIDCEKAEMKGGVFKYRLAGEPVFPGSSLRIDAPIPIVPPGGGYAGYDVASDGPDWLNAKDKDQPQSPS